jgi:hypothetical protein
MTACTLCRRELEDDGAFTVDLSTNLILAGEEIRQASPMVAEFATILAKHRPNVVSRESLMSGLYGAYVHDAPDDKVLNVYAHKLRRVLAGTGFSVEAQHGFGFRMLDQEWDGLTVNERWLVGYLRSHHEKHGVWPGQNKLRLASPYESANTFYAAVGRLQRKGLVRRHGEKPNRRVEALDMERGSE